MGSEARPRWAWWGQSKKLGFILGQRGNCQVGES